MTAETETREQFVARLMNLVHQHIRRNDVRVPLVNRGLKELRLPKIQESRSFTIRYTGPVVLVEDRYATSIEDVKAALESDGEGWDEINLPEGWLNSEHVEFIDSNPPEPPKEVDSEPPLSIEELKHRIPRIVMQWVAVGDICRYGAIQFVEQLGLKVPEMKIYEVQAPVTLTRTDEFTASSEEEAIEMARKAWEARNYIVADDAQVTIRNSYAT